MQQAMMTVLVLALVRGALSGDSADGNFGPSNCIFVSRSAAGSCLITTDCQGLDTSEVEFGIRCVSDGKTLWHSYGEGGFEANEQFDTGLQCDDCKAPNADSINGEVTNVDPAPLGEALQRVPKITSADGVNLGPTSLIGSSHQQKVENGYAVAEIANFADTDNSADPSIDSVDPSDLEDQPEAPALRQHFLRPRHSHILQNTNVQTVAPEIESFGPNNQALSEKLQVLFEGVKELEVGMRSIGENVQRLNTKVFPTVALTQTRGKPIRHVHKKSIHGVQNVRAALPQSGKGEDDGDDETGVGSGGFDSEGRGVQEEQEERETKLREQEAHEREEKQRACAQGNEFNFGGDC